MAVVKVPQATRLQIKVQTGISQAGNPVYRLRTLQNIKTSASDADLYAVADAISGLQANTVIGFARQDDANLMDQ